MHNLRIVCPDCKGALTERADNLVCESCGTSFAVVDGIPTFAPRDEFYEGAYEATTRFRFNNPRGLSATLYKFFIGCHMLWYEDRFIKKDAAILDIGCGGGNEFLATKGAVVGVDLSLACLKRAKGFYTKVIQSGTLTLPFEDGTFDAAVSTCFLEHIPPEDKPVLFAEIRRLLKTGGVMIHLCDADSQSGLFRWLKGYPDAFQKHFVEQDGHVGYEKASELLRKITDAGVTVLRRKAMGKTRLQPPETFHWMDNEYKDKAGFLTRTLIQTGSWLYRTSLPAALYRKALLLWDSIVEPFLPLDHAFKLLVAARKVD